MRFAARDINLCEYCTYETLYAEKTGTIKKHKKFLFFVVRKAQKWRDERFYHWNKKERKKFFQAKPHICEQPTYNKRMFSTWPKQHAYEEWETILCMYIAFLQHELTHLLCSINLICTLSLLVHNMYTCNATEKKT